MMRTRALHLLILLAVWLVGVSQLAAQTPQLLLNETFQPPPNRVYSFWTNRVGGPSANEGPNQWIVNRIYRGLQEYPATRAQRQDNVPNPDCGYLHIHDAGSRRNPHNASYNATAASDRFTYTNQAICTRLLRDVQVSFWWLAGGSPTAWGEFWYSRDGGQNWERVERSPGQFQFRDQPTWRQETFRVPGFSGAGDLRIGFRWVNEGGTGRPGVSFAIDNVEIRGTTREPNTLPAIRVELDGNSFCASDEIEGRIVHDAPYYCFNGTYTLQLSNPQGTFAAGVININLGNIASEFTASALPLRLPAGFFADLPAAYFGSNCIRFRVVRQGSFNANGNPPNYTVNGIESPCFTLRNCSSSIEILSALPDADGDPLSACMGGILDVNFKSLVRAGDPEYQATNEYLLELSDSKGDFPIDPAQRTIIGRFDPDPDNATDPQDPLAGLGAIIQGQLPAGLTPSCNYRVRVLATAPNRISDIYGPICVRTCDLRVVPNRDIDLCMQDTSSNTLVLNFRSGERGSEVTYGPQNEFRVQFARQTDFSIVTEANFPGVTEDGQISIRLPLLPELIDQYNLEPGAYYVRVASTQGSDPTDRASNWVRFNLGFVDGSESPYEVLTPELCGGTTPAIVRVRVRNYHARRNSVFALITPAGGIALVFGQPGNFQPGGVIQFGLNLAATNAGTDLSGWSLAEFNFTSGATDCGPVITSLGLRTTSCLTPRVFAPILLNRIAGDTLCSFSPIDFRFQAEGFPAGANLQAVLYKGTDLDEPIFLEGLITLPAALGLDQFDCDSTGAQRFFARVPVSSRVPSGCDYFLRVRNSLTGQESESFGPFCLKACDIETNATTDVALCASASQTTEVRFVVRTNAFTRQVTYGANNQFRLQFYDPQENRIAYEGEFNGTIRARTDTVMTLEFPPYNELIARGLRPRQVYYVRLVSTAGSDPLDRRGSYVRFVFAKETTTPQVVSLIDTVCVDFSTGAFQFNMPFRFLNHDPDAAGQYEFTSPIFGGGAPFNFPATALAPDGSLTLGPVGLPRGFPPADIEYRWRMISNISDLTDEAVLPGNLPPFLQGVCNSAQSLHAEFSLQPCITQVRLLTQERGRPVCMGSAFDLTFFAPGNYFEGNQFSVELSDQNGNFANFRLLATSALNQQLVGQGVVSIIGGRGRIESQLPLDLPEGDNYRVRIRSRLPEGRRITANVFGPFSIRRCDITTNNFTDVELCLSTTDNVVTPVTVSYRVGQRTQNDVSYDPGANRFGLEILQAGGVGLVRTVAPGELVDWLPRTTDGEFRFELPFWQELLNRYDLEPNTTYYMRVFASNATPEELAGGTVIRFRYVLNDRQLQVTVAEQTFCLPSLRNQGPSPQLLIEGKIENFDPNAGTRYRLTATNMGPDLLNFLAQNNLLPPNTNNANRHIIDLLQDGEIILQNPGEYLDREGNFRIGNSDLNPPANGIPIPPGFYPFDLFLTIEELPVNDVGTLTERCQRGRTTVLYARMTNCLQTQVPDPLRRPEGPVGEICAGSVFDVRFRAPGVFPDNNRFRLELSSPEGSFANPILLNSIVGNGVVDQLPEPPLTDLVRIEGRLPINLIPSTSYRVRVIGTHPGSETTEYGPFSIVRCDIRTNNLEDVLVCVNGGESGTDVLIPFTVGHEDNEYRPGNEFVVEIRRRDFEAGAPDMQLMLLGELNGRVSGTGNGVVRLSLPPYRQLVTEYNIRPNVTYYLRVVATDGFEPGIGTWVRFRYAVGGEPVEFTFLQDTFCLGELPTNIPRTIQFYTLQAQIRNYDPLRNSDYLMRASFFGLSGFLGEVVIPVGQITAQGRFNFTDAVTRHPALGRAQGFEPLTFTVTLQEILRGIPGCDSGAVSAPRTVVLTNCTRIPDRPIMMQFEPVGDTLCMLSALDVRFVCEGVFPSANEYILELSDINGNFDRPLELARIPGGDYRGGGVFNTFIPDNKARIPQGFGYRLRVATNRPPVRYFPLEGRFAIKHCDITTNINQATNRPQDLDLCLIPNQDSVSFSITYRTGFSGENVRYAPNNEFQIQILRATDFRVVAEGRYGRATATGSGTMRVSLPFNRQLLRVEGLIPNFPYYLRVIHTASDVHPNHRLGSLIRFRYSTVNQLAGVKPVTDTICLNQNPELPIGSAQQVPVDFFIEDYDRSRGNQYFFESNLTGAPIPLGPGGIPVRNDGFVRILFNLPVNFQPNVMIATVREVGAIGACNGDRSFNFPIVFTNCTRTVQPFPTRAGNRVCVNSAFDVSFAAPGNYPGLNTFLLELSDAEGSFANPRLLRAINGGGLIAVADTGGVLPARIGEFQTRIPEDVPPGTGYRVRVRGTQPEGRFTTWGPFTIERCVIETDPQEMITMCLFDDQSDTLRLTYRANRWNDPAVSYASTNRFVVEVLDRRTMRVLITGDAIGQQAGTGDGQIAFEIPSARILRETGLLENQLYYLRIRATEITPANQSLGTLVRFVYTIRQRKLELRILQDTLCIEADLTAQPIIVNSAGFPLVQFRLPVQITNFDPTKETTYEFRFSFRNPHFERGHLTLSPNIIPSRFINTDGTVTLFFRDWIFGSQRSDYFVEVREFGETNAACSGDYSDAAFFTMANCIRTLQPVMERAIIFDTVCVNSVFDVPLASYGLFAFNNVFELQLSDVNGSFANPRVIGEQAGFIPNPLPFQVGGAVALIEGQIPNDVVPGNNYFVRVYSRSSGIASEPWVVPYGPFSIKHCDIATNNNTTPFTICVQDGDTTEVELPFSINNHELNSVYDPTNLFSVQVLDRNMNVLAEGGDLGQIRRGSPLPNNQSTIVLRIPPFRELQDRFNITINSVYYVRVTATRSSRMGDVLGTLMRMSVSLAGRAIDSIVLITPRNACLNIAEPLEFRVFPYDPSKPTVYEVQAQFAGRPDIQVFRVAPAQVDADGTMRVAWFPELSTQPLPTLDPQQLIFRVREVNECGNGAWSEFRQVNLNVCTFIQPPVASRDFLGDTLCLGSAIDVPFTSTGRRLSNPVTGVPENNYIIQLFDTTDRFRTRPINMGSLRSVAAAGLIAGRVPDLLASWPDTDNRLTRCDFILRVASDGPQSGEMTEFGPFCLKKCDIRTNAARPADERDILLCIPPRSTGQPLEVPFRTGVFNLRPEQTYPSAQTFEVEILNVANFNRLVPTPEGRRMAITPTYNRPNGQVTVTLPSVEVLRNQFGLLPNTNYYLRVVAREGSNPTNLRGSLIRFSFGLVDINDAPNIRTEVPRLQLCRERGFNSPYSVVIDDYEQIRNSNYEFWAIAVADTNATTMANLRRDILTGVPIVGRAGTLTPANITRRIAPGGREFGVAEFPFVGGLANAPAWNVLTSSQYMVIFLRENVAVRAGTGCPSQLSNPVIIPINSGIFRIEAGSNPMNICKNESMTFVAASTGGTANTKYRWTYTNDRVGVVVDTTIFGNPGSPVFLFDQLGASIVRLEVENACGIQDFRSNGDLLELLVIVSDTPRVAVRALENDVCPGATVNLVATNEEGSAVTWVWLPNRGITRRDGRPNDVLAVVDSTTTYTVTAFNGGCQDSKTITVRTLPLPTLQMQRRGDTLFVEAGYTYQWFKDGQEIPGATQNFYVITLEPGSNDPFVGSGNYNVTYTAANGCSRSTRREFFTPVGVPAPMRGVGELTLYPNPFREATTLSYHLTEPASVQIELFDALGQFVASLANEKQSPGAHRYRWSARERGFGSGLYLMRLTVNGETQTLRLIEVE